MTVRKTPSAPHGRPQADVRGNVCPLALERWDARIHSAADDDDERSISVYDVIGADDWTGEGMTAKRVAGILRRLGAGPVTVNINSPGGDMFEGLAIYNLLREHKGEIKVRVIGLAASAASIIAMAGDSVEIGRSAFLMIHNCWVMAVGNRHDMHEVGDMMEPFDRAMADIYSAKTGETGEAMGAMMDAETWIGGSDAVSQGFADALLPSDQIEKSKDTASASVVRRVEAALRASGMPKSEAVKLISQLKSVAGDPGGSVAGDPDELGEGDPAEISAQAILASLRSFAVPTT